ncbi:hypothetical protein B0H17DRAFT_1258292 [Mycena rosella]|uniref:F-box domain-containing protein n=1 Tax=Mycena rosella TaxID=1033263 RepID=A0AAD7G6P1_MYCRO|nr:hypothetical protein B0H17DRAFT_1258292 [Mycena rosella]
MTSQISGSSSERVIRARSSTILFEEILQMSHFNSEDGVFKDIVNPTISVPFRVSTRPIMILSIQAAKFFNALADTPALPPTPQHVSLCWKLDLAYVGRWASTAAYDLLKFADVSAALAARCPGLVSLWLDGSDYLFRWRKALDGTVNAATADGIACGLADAEIGFGTGLIGESTVIGVMAQRAASNVSCHEMASQVPDELWLETFGLLPRKSLADISLTNRTFRRIMCPLLFSHLEFYIISLHGSTLIEAKDLQRCLERLAFWSSDEIASLLKASREEELVSSETLMATFLRKLPRFVGIRQFCAVAVDLKQNGVTALCRPPALAGLHIHMCHIASGERIGPIGLNVSSCAINDSLARHSQWIPLLRPDSLRQLRVAYTDTTYTDTFPGATIDMIPSFPRVHVLSAEWRTTWDKGQTLAFLYKFPSVEHLRLAYDGPVLDGPDVHALELFPLLREYSGPSHTLHIFLPIPTLIRLTIEECSPGILISKLKEMRTPHYIPSLDVFFDNHIEDLDNAVLDTLCTFFPRLTALRITTTFHIGADDLEEDGTNAKATTFFAALADTPALPPTLKYLGISWEFDRDILELEGAPPVSKLPDFNALRHALVARCHGLKSLWLDGGDFLFQWRKFVDETVIETTVEDFDTAKVVGLHEWNKLNHREHRIMEIYDYEGGEKTEWS